MLRFVLGEQITGRHLIELPAVSGSWSQTLGGAGALSCVIDLRTQEARGHSLALAARGPRAFLAAIDGDTILQAGPIWKDTYDHDAGTVTLNATGLRTLFEHRTILPPTAANTAVTTWTVPAENDPSKTVPNPALTTTLTGSLGQIVKDLIQQATSWPGGALPIVFPANESGNHARTYPCTDFKQVAEAIGQIADVIDGVEARFLPRFTTGKLGIEWVLQVGTTTAPLLVGVAEPHWDLSVPESPLSGVSVSRDYTKLASVSWATGGRSGDNVLVSRAMDTRLTDWGYPLLEVLDTSHSSVNEQATLDGYAAERALRSATPAEQWSFGVEAHPVDRAGIPVGAQLGSYQAGDFCRVTVRDNPWLPVATHRLRILGLDGDMSPQVQVSCTPEVEE